MTFVFDLVSGGRRKWRQVGQWWAKVTAHHWGAIACGAVSTERKQFQTRPTSQTSRSHLQTTHWPCRHSRGRGMRSGYTRRQRSKSYLRIRSSRWWGSWVLTRNSTQSTASLWTKRKEPSYSTPRTLKRATPSSCSWLGNSTTKESRTPSSDSSDGGGEPKPSRLFDCFARSGCKLPRKSNACTGGTYWPNCYLREQPSRSIRHAHSYKEESRGTWSESEWSMRSTW